MEWIDRMNAAMDYLEAHLTDKIDVSELARIACCSSFHFQRMFSYMAGVPLGEYVRRRRMTRAAEDLCNGARVTDVAARYGYDSPTAFNRAFQSVHGVPPSRARSATLQAYTPIRFSLTVTGGAPLAYRMEALDAFSIAGYAAPIGKTLAENFQSVPALWERVAREEALAGAFAHANRPAAGPAGRLPRDGRGLAVHDRRLRGGSGGGHGAVARARLPLGGVLRAGRDANGHSGSGAPRGAGMAARLRL